MVDSINLYTDLYTVNVVIFAGGKFREKCRQDTSRRGNFHDTASFSFIKAYEFYFCVGVIFAKNTKARQTRKLPPRENFHVYSTFWVQWQKARACWKVDTALFMYRSLYLLGEVEQGQSLLEG